MTQSPRWTKRPEGSTWADFGPDDQCGRMNLITPAKVLQGIQEVREGHTFNLHPAAAIQHANWVCIWVNSGT